MSIRIDGTNTSANPGITGADTDTGLQFGTNEVSIVTGGTDRIVTGTDIAFKNSSNTERMRILSSGGITFNGDTAAANALDDYEEGTWTPADTHGSVGAFTINLAKYTKIGNLVRAYIDVIYPSSSVGGQARINLPLPMTTNATYGSGIAGWSSNGEGVKFHVGSQTAYVMKLETGSSSGNSHMSPANLSNLRIIGDFFYESYD
jgi:hypothetical protein|tara:strand:- start:1141 stop:1752 length:612 start_codon:yes stop_codon:yes gene_type:complete